VRQGENVIITLTPNPSVDRTYEVPMLMPGKVHRATRQHREPSGKGVNLTRALAANGIPSLAVLPCGGPEGSQLAALLDGENVTYRTVRITGSVRVNISLTEPGGRATKINAAGPALTRRELAELTETALAAASPGDWIVCSGSLPPGAPRDYYAHVGRQARRARLRFALDTSGEALESGLTAAPDVVKPNVSELAGLTGTPITTLGEAIAGATDLLTRGPGSVLLSLGPDGALLVTGDGRWHASAAAPAVRSTVGAGDALLAGFLAAGGAGRGALHEAIVWATAAVGVEGSYVPPIGKNVRTGIEVDIEEAARLPVTRRLTDAAPRG
jgi:1-phosphofructokinase